MDIRTIHIPPLTYTVEVISFEDKGEQDNNGRYEYYYHGIIIRISIQDKFISARKYHDEKNIHFLTNPYPFFNEHADEILTQLSSWFDVKEFKYLDANNPNGYTRIR